jgi:hypothetical protein
MLYVNLHPPIGYMGSRWRLHGGCLHLRVLDTVMRRGRILSDVPEVKQASREEAETVQLPSRMQWMPL